MSRSYQYSYALEAARRRELENARNKQLVAESIIRFMSLIDNLRRNGRAAYVPNEVKRLEAEIKRVEQLSSSDPAAARNACYSIESSISTINALAESAIAEFQIKEIKRAQAAKAERQHLLEEYYRIVAAINDPVVVSMAQTDLAVISNDISTGGKFFSKSDIETAVASAVNIAEKKALIWKKQTAEKQKKLAAEHRIKLAEDAIQRKNIEDAQKSQSLIDRIRMLRQQMDEGQVEADTVQHEVAAIESAADEAKITEDVRRETVRVIVKQLRQQEFTVSTPEIINNGENGFVRIIASKPSGKKAVCQIDLSGKIAYKFDHYEGMTCLKDIEKFNVDLQSVYSVKLSDERIIWSNPDKLSKDSNQTPQDRRRNG